MKIHDKLLIGYLAIACLTAVLGYSAISRMKGIDAQFDLLSRDVLTLSGLLEDMRTSGSNLTATTSTFSLLQDLQRAGHPSTGASGVLGARSAVTTSLSEFKRSVRRYESMVLAKFPEELHLQKLLHSKGDQLYQAASTLLQVAGSGRRDVSTSDLQLKLSAADQEFRRSVNQALAEEQQEYVQRRVRIKDGLSRAVTTILIIALLVITVVVTSGSIIAGTVSRALIRLQNAVKVLSWGDLDVRIDIHSNDELGQLGQSFNTMADELKRSRDELLDAKTFLGDVIRVMVDPLLVVSSTGVICTVNQATCTLLGYDEHELLEQHAQLILPELCADNRSLRELVSSGSANGGEQYLLARSGARIPVSLSASLLCGDGDGSDRIVCLAKDMSDQLRVAEKLRRSETRYRSLIENVQDIITILDQDGSIMFASPSVAGILGYQPGELEGNNVYSFLHPEDLQRVLETFQGSTQSPGQTACLEIRFLHRDGSWRILESIGRNLFHDPYIRGLFVNARDITERKQAEESLRKSEARLAEAQRIAHVGNWEWDVVNDHLYWSDEVYRIFCVDPLWFDPTYNSLLNAVHPEDRDLVDAQFTACLREKVPLSIDHRVLLPDGRERTVHSEAEVTFNRQGRAVRFAGTVQDITERKEAERRLSHFAAELQETNEEIKSFANIVSHDLRAPLVNIRGFAAELRDASSEIGTITCSIAEFVDLEKRMRLEQLIGGEIPEALEFIDASVKRMDGLVTAILKLSRLGRQELKPEQLQLNEVVATLLKSQAHRIEQSSAVVSIAPLPSIVADRISMEQIIGNLLDNALKYLEPDRPGKIVIKGERSRGVTTVSISDNGRGIAPSDHEKVFDLFRRVGRRDVPGEGMGLAYVKTLVRRYGGRIWCESAFGQGSTFTFTLPDGPELESDQVVAYSAVRNG